MPKLSKAQRKTGSLPDNSTARHAIEAIAQIDVEARQKKMAQLEGLQAAKVAIQGRIRELDHQLTQIDAAIASISGTNVSKTRRVRRNLEEGRERVARWMAGRKGQKFVAGDLIREFPEFQGTIMSVFLKPLVQEGRIHTDASLGMRRTKYFVAE